MKQFLLQMDDSHNGGNPPEITKKNIAHRNGTTRILFSIFSNTHDLYSITMTCIAIQDYNCKELFTAIQDKEKFKALVETVERKVTTVRCNRHIAVDEIDHCTYAPDGDHGYKPLVSRHSESKGEIKRI